MMVTKQSVNISPSLWCLCKSDICLCKYSSLEFLTYIFELLWDLDIKHHKQHCKPGIELAFFSLVWWAFQFPFTWIGIICRFSIASSTGTSGCCKYSFTEKIHVQRNSFTAGVGVPGESHGFKGHQPQAAWNRKFILIQTYESMHSWENHSCYDICVCKYMCIHLISLILTFFLILHIYFCVSGEF